MKKIAILTIVCGLVLGASILPSSASFSIGDWQTTPTQVSGDATWRLVSTTLPSWLYVNFDASLPGFQIQEESAIGTGHQMASGNYTLEFTVTLSDAVFTSVELDSTHVGVANTDVTKYLRDSASDPSPFLTLTSHNGASVGPFTISPGRTTLHVYETIYLSQTGALRSFSDTYTVTPVPEPTTTIAGIGALGLLLFGAGVHSKRSVLCIGK
jgi:hypothetical protein